MCMSCRLFKCINDLRKYLVLHCWFYFSAIANEGKERKVANKILHQNNCIKIQLLSFIIASLYCNGEQPHMLKAYCSVWSNLKAAELAENQNTNLGVSMFPLPEFGSAHVLDKTTTHTVRRPLKPSNAYGAPETLTSKTYDGVMADIWSLYVHQKLL